MREKKNFFPQNEGNLVFIWLLVFPPSEKGWHGGEEKIIDSQFLVSAEKPSQGVYNGT